ncbi:MBL fold metallo-hydrolase [Chitinimonas lacunae]|uniref:MBL fold metallo-hydrolase n=1 Tax=Chitinimonas lacunae TaxID=1963018 RepID=A0ABV8MJA3_9NEIS
MTQVPHVKGFYDPTTGTISYVVYDRVGGHAAVVDTVLDYDPKSGRTRTDNADQLSSFIVEHGLRLDWILETHAHADHLSAAIHLKSRLGGQIAIGESIREVQKIFAALYNLDDLPADGRQFDHLFQADETFRIGDLQAQALFVPGHTPADMAYRIGDAIFVGDTLFMPDVGTARCDFPGGDAATLYRSIRRLLSLPETTRLFMCHDYPPPGRQPSWECTVSAQRLGNIHVHDGVSEQEFVTMRESRDRTLAMPQLMLPAVQVNIRAGALPKPEANGRVYLKIPVNAL